MKKDILICGLLSLALFIVIIFIFRNYSKKTETFVDSKNYEARLTVIDVFDKHLCKIATPKEINRYSEFKTKDAIIKQIKKDFPNEFNENKCNINLEKSKNSKASKLSEYEQMTKNVSSMKDKMNKPISKIEKYKRSMGRKNKKVKNDIVDKKMEKKGRKSRPKRKSKVETFSDVLHDEDDIDSPDNPFNARNNIMDNDPEIQYSKRMNRINNLNTSQSHLKKEDEFENENYDGSPVNIRMLKDELEQNVKKQNELNKVKTLHTTNIQPGITFTDPEEQYNQQQLMKLHDDSSLNSADYAIQQINQESDEMEDMENMEDMEDTDIDTSFETENEGMVDDKVLASSTIPPSLTQMENMNILDKSRPLIRDDDESSTESESESEYQPSSSESLSESEELSDDIEFDSGRSISNLEKMAESIREAEENDEDDSDDSDDNEKYEKEDLEGFIDNMDTDTEIESNEENDADDENDSPSRSNTLVSRKGTQTLSIQTKNEPAIRVRRNHLMEMRNHLRRTNGVLENILAQASINP